MHRLSNRFSLGNRLARLSTNWGLPDALQRLGLAEPSAPLHPAPVQPGSLQSPIAEAASETPSKAPEEAAEQEAPDEAETLSPAEMRQAGVTAANSETDSGGDNRLGTTAVAAQLRQACVPHRNSGMFQSNAQLWGTLPVTQLQSAFLGWLR